ncbi:hypothetical protein BJ912DRAFT_1091697 [Pholiota molesta]|nr:hypothetical protein BJ912DRAFT_1091697 [Pholiota molesta]
MEKKQDDLRQALHDVKQDNIRLKSANTNLIEEAQVADEFQRAALFESSSKAEIMKKQNRALKMKVKRARGSRIKAVEKAKQKATKEWKRRERFHLKSDKGVVTDATRALIRDLVKIGLSVSHVSAAIKSVAHLLDVEVEGNVGIRSIGRIILEGGIASQMQIVEEVKHTRNVTISGDGTSLRNLNYESKHLNFKTTLYHDEDDIIPINAEAQTQILPGERVTRFLGLTSAKDHTSATQVQGWKDSNQALHDVYNESPRGLEKHINPTEAPSKYTGYNGDHAADQKKAASMIEAWMIESDRIVRGEAAMKTWSADALLALLVEESQNKINRAGGLDAFNALPMDDQAVQNKATFSAVCFRIGETAFSSMSEEEQQAADLFIWAGCCMHKELNAVKGGDAAMRKFWISEDLTPPIQLMNKDNDAAATAGPSSARDRAIAVSIGGASKLTSLAGAIFNHKDEKKGQGDTFRIFFENALGYLISFPDTSNTRYQSHCEASAALLLHLSLYTKFLEQVRDKKEKRRFNHMELNVHKGLQDIPTLTELAVFVLYGQAISHPYLRQIRGPMREEHNILETGPLHERVKEHCRAIISCPSLLLSQRATYETGSMDGKPWDQPEAFYAVQALSHSLPHLEGALVAFFTGALETWERFTSEFSPGGKISNLSALDRDRAWVKTTNDDNEGKLGELRTGSRRAPNMALHQRNARMMYRKNNTETYIDTILNKDDLRYLRKKAREVDSGKLEKERRQDQAKGDQEIVERKRKKIKDRTAIKQKASDALDLVKCRFNIGDIQDAPGTNTLLDSELGWFRRIDAEVPAKGKVSTKILKISALCAAVERYHMRLALNDGSGDTEHESSSPDSSGADSDIDSDADMELGY